MQTARMFVHFPLQDIVFNFVVAVLIFCAAVALAVYIPRWQGFLPGANALQRSVIERIIGASGAAAVSCVITYPIRGHFQTTFPFLNNVIITLIS